MSKVATEVAEAEFEKWVDAMGLRRKLNPEKLDADDKKGFALNRDIIIGAIEDGNLALDDNGEFVFTPAVGDQSPIKFPEPDGATVIAGQTKNSDFSKLLAAITKSTPQRFQKMKSRDLVVCDAIATLFLVK